MDASLASLLASGAPYQFQKGKLFNLEASDFVKDHGDVAGKEIAHAIRRALADRRSAPHHQT